MRYGYNGRAAWATLVNGAATARNRGCRSLTTGEFRGTLFPRLISRGSIEARSDRAPTSGRRYFRG